MAWYRFLRCCGWWILVLFFGYRAYGVRNVPRSGPVILAGNHQSYMDPIMVGVPLARAVEFMGRESLFRSRLFGALLRSARTFPVSTGRRTSLRAMREALRQLQAFRQLLLFPEGTRSHDGSIDQLQSGLAVLAARSGASVVPVVIDGAFECWPRSRRLPRFGRVCVAFGRSLRYEGHGSDQAEQFMDELRERMLELQRGLRSGEVQAGRMT